MKYVIHITIKMKKIIMVLVAMLMTFAAGAQVLQDVVYLHNGSVVRGTLIEQVPNVKIRTSDGSLWVFKHEEVDKITSEPAVQQSQQQYDVQKYDAPKVNDSPGISSHRSSGYKNLSSGLRIFADVAVMAQTSYYTCSGVGYSGSFGRQMTPNLYAGLGLSAQIYIDYWYYGPRRDDKPELYAQLPLFADLRYDVFAAKVSPFLAARAGYAVCVDEVCDHSGFYLNPGIGIRVKSMSISVGADLVKLHEPWYFLEMDRSLNIESTTVKWQSSIMFRFAYEWGGRQRH